MLYFLHKNTRCLLLAAGYLLTATVCRSQPHADTAGWTLNQCIEYAWSHNLGVKQAELNRDIAGNNRTGSKAAILPQVSGMADNLWNVGRTIDPFTNTFATSEVLSQDFYISSSFTLFGGEQLINTEKQNEANFKASSFDVDVNKNNLALNIASGFLQVLLDKELLEEANEQYEVTLQQVEHTKQLVDAGQLARSNLLDVQAQQANDELNRVNAQNQLDLATLSLAQLLDIDSVQLFKIATPDILIPDNPSIDQPEQVYDKALTTQPDIKSAEEKWESAEYARQAAAGALYPKLSFTASIGTGFSGSDKSTSIVNDTIAQIGSQYLIYPTTVEGNLISWQNQMSQNLNKSFGFRLNIPILNGLQSNMAYRNAKLNSLNNYYSYQTAEMNLRKNIQQAYSDALGALKKYHATQQSVASLHEAFTYTKEKFDVGMATALDYNTAKTNLTKAQSDLLQAKYNYVFKIKVLDYYEGKPLNL